jgi:hypothetical protein
MSAPLQLNSSGPDVVALQQALQAARTARPRSMDPSDSTEAAVLALKE